MQTPYVIDNQEHWLADVLNGLLGQQGGKMLMSVLINMATGAFRESMGL